MFIKKTHMKSKNLLKIFSPNLPKTKKELELIKRDFLLKHVKFETLDRYDISDVNFNDSSIQVNVVVGRNLTSVIGGSLASLNDELDLIDLIDELDLIGEVIDIEHDVIEVDFKEEFKEELSLGLERYCSKFRFMLDKKSIYTVDKLEGFKKRVLKTINEQIEYYSTQSDMPGFFKILIIDFYNKFYEYVSKFNTDEVQISDKLKFKLNKNQVILLFQTMFDQGVISGMSELDLYRILDEKTKYTKDGVYIDMKDTRIQANKFKKGNASPAASLELLSQKFKKDFFTAMS
jgi:hypothetical protein